ncbi:MAG: DNA integrity scanning protein DisA nucleotide-binding domain protein [Nanoarchaeota archaeon]
MNEDSKKIEEILIQVGLRIAKRGEGALFVVGNVDYEPLVEQSVPSFRISDNLKLLESLALIDGAVIVGKDGFMKAYGAMIKTTKTFKGYGTRHSAGLTAAQGDNLVVLISEEDRKVRILKDEKMIMQLDALEKGVEQQVSGAVKILESVGAGTLGALGTGLLVPALGLAFLPGVVVFGSAWYLGKMLLSKKEN